MPNCILTPCGTSLLTNHADGDERKRVSAHANKAAPAADFPQEDCERLQGLIDRVETAMAQADQATAKRKSAEINGLCAYYGDRLAGHSRDFHQLLCTDTWLGETTARLVEKWLRQNGFTTVDVHRQKDLQTRELDCFQSALSEIVRWCSETLVPYRERGYYIAFNLTGGFKSVQGFLQTLAQFYADESFYIFESSTDLLRIPRLPIRMDACQVVQENLAPFRRMALGLIQLEDKALTAIPETLYWRFGGQAALTPWGEMVWATHRRELYEQALWPSPSPRLIYGCRFEKSIAGLAPDRLFHINEKIDLLARFLEKGENNLAKLDFKPLARRHGDCTYECDAWHDQDAKRLFGHYEGERFVLDKMDKGLH